MTPLEKLNLIKYGTLREVEREFLTDSNEAEDVKWLISRIEQLEQAFNYICIAQMGELDYTKDFFELTKNVTRSVLKEMPKK